MTPEDRDRLASVFNGRRCPLCSGPLLVTKPKYGWGAQGARAQCSRCRLQLRMPWVPLKKAVLKVVKESRS